MTIDETKDYLRSNPGAIWREPLGTEPQVRYRVDAPHGWWHFFTLAGARAFLEGELKGQGRLVSLCLLVTMLCSCATAPAHAVRGKRKMRVTYYAASEDRKWGSRTASGRRAKPGTVAAERSVPFGTWLRIPALARFFGRDWFRVEDRGSAVQSRRASHGALPVVDVYTPDRRTMRRLAAAMPPVLEVE